MSDGLHEAKPLTGEAKRLMIENHIRVVDAYVKATHVGFADARAFLREMRDGEPSAAQIVQFIAEMRVAIALEAAAQVSDIATVAQGGKTGDAA